MAVPETQPREVARPLRTLIPLIKNEAATGEAAGLEHYRKAGELLLEAREQMQHGEWAPWLKRHFEFSKDTARRWMALAEESQKPRRRAFSRLSDVLEAHRSSHQPTWHEPIRKAISHVDVGRLARERQDQEKEERLTRELGMRLISIGYRALSAKLHPDRGGSTEGMARLNRVRKLLTDAL